MGDGTSGYGSVPYDFRIGKYEVTISQYTAFLNSVAASDLYGLYDVGMSTNMNVAGIARSGSPGSYTYSVITNNGDSGNRPISHIYWFDAARFANWMHNGATSGASTETGAYNLNGATNGIFLKNPDAKWWIPSENEWYKAAYYKGGGTNAGYWKHATRSDSTPGNAVGGANNQANYRSNFRFAVSQTTNYSAAQNYLTDVGGFSNSHSPYGTYDQGGNLYEWTDAVKLSTNRQLRGGDWLNISVPESNQQIVYPPTGTLGYQFGFRLATAPSQTTNVFIALEVSTNVGGGWQASPITTNMITPQGEINAGAMTNTATFYRLKIRQGPPTVGP